jgi:hypothetical protein
MLHAAIFGARGGYIRLTSGRLRSRLRPMKERAKISATIVGEGLRLTHSLPLASVALLSLALIFSPMDFCRLVRRNWLC